MAGSFKSKMVLMTGAASEIGRAAALAFAREGEKVIVSDIVIEGDKETVQLTKEPGGEASFIQADISKTLRVGCAMDLVVVDSRVIVTMERLSDDGKPEVVKKCTYDLTTPHCVSLIVTDLAVIEVTERGLILKEVAPGWSPTEVQALTDAPVIISPNCKEITFWSQCRIKSMN